MRLGLAFIPGMPAEVVVDLVREAEHLGYDDVYLPDQTFHRDPWALLALLGRERVERAFLPAVALHALAEAAGAHGAEIPVALRDVVTAGEQLRITPAVRALIQPDMNLAKLSETAYAEGMQPLRASAAAQVARGVTTIPEVVNVLPPTD
jgi:alkanesulfonate monooxygenase SsuD/methylene tetrahydromethanopterin reductase-like flavin-dependent oxidoreductase (luciferase family)